MYKYYLYLFLYVILPFIGYAQHLQISKYDKVEGYPPYASGYMMQDRQGWMWFSAGYEIVRYDGHRFKEYPPATGVVFHYAFELYEIGDEIWVNAIPYMLKVEGDSLRRLDIKNNYLPQSVVSDNISDGIQLHGQYYFLCKSGLYILKDRELQPLITDDSMNLTGAEDLFVLNDSLLVGNDLTQEKLIVFHLNTKKFYYGAQKISRIIKHDDKIYCSAPGKGIFQLKDIKINKGIPDITSEMIIPFTRSGTLQFFERDNQGNFWLFFRDNKVVMVQPNGLREMISNRHDFKDLHFLNSFLDRENNLWLSARATILKVSGQPWERITKADGLLSNSVVRIDKGVKDGQLWIKTNQGTNILEDNTIKTVLIHGKPFTGTLIHIQGNRLLYFSGNQLYTAEYHSNSIIKKKLLSQFPTPVITAAVDSRGSIYIACHSGLYIFAHDKKRKLNNNIYKALLVDSRERLWAGQFSSGLHCFQLTGSDSKAQAALILNIDTIGNDKPRVQSIRAIAEIPGGPLLIGTRYNGLFILKIKDNQLIAAQYFNKEKGLASNNVWDLSIDEKGNCWIATSGGINSLRYENRKWIIKEESKRRQILETRTILADTENKIRVGSYPGFISFFPDTPPSIYPFSVAITDVRINGIKRLPEQIKKLKADDNDILIEFSSNTYRLEDGVVYSWRLSKGNKWSQPSTNHSIHFSALKPGNYHFSVRAKDAYGQWSKNRAGFQFIILPPLWQQTWFILLIAFFLISLLYLFYRYRINQMKKVERLRNHIARDLHDEIGSTLTSINILSKVSRSNLKTDQKKSEELLQKVIYQSEEMQQNMSDIVWAIKADNDRMTNMVAHMREYLGETLEPANIDSHFSVADPLLHKSLQMQQRRDFFLIFKEAINNVARHSGAQHVNITLHLIKNWIHLRICDDGKGWHPGKSYSGNGLRNMKERAAALNGSLEINTGKDGGFCVELKIPAD